MAPDVADTRRTSLTLVDVDLDADADVVGDGAVDLSAAFVGDVDDKGGAHVQGAVNDHVYVDVYRS